MSAVPGEAVIRPIRAEDAAAFRDLQLEALRRCPLAFTADLAEAEPRPLATWREQAERSGGGADGVIVLAVVGGGGGGGGLLAGMAGAYRPTQPKLAHAGTVRGVYVREAYRMRGVGRRLVLACADRARARGLATLRLSVVASGNAAARRCYERRGFVRYGTEPMAVQWAGQFYDEELMALRLLPPAD